jgi:phenol 2-monooxygenase
MIIPREDDKVRLYVQLGDRDAVDEESGRVDKSKIGPHELLDASVQSFCLIPLRLNP